jgi:hypothetical protein
MMNLAQIVGAATMAMMYKPEFERERGAAQKRIGELSKRLASGEIAAIVIDRISKMNAERLHSNRLAKSDISPAAIGKMVGDLVAAELIKELRLDEIEEHLRKAREAVPAYAAWLRNEPFPKTQPTKGPLRDYGVMAVATKGGGERGDELTALEMPQHQPPAIDPNKAVAETFLARRHQGRQP